MSSQNKSLLWIIIIVVVLVLLVVFVTGTNRDGQEKEAQVTTEEIAPGETKSTAETGEVVANFPRHLILDQDARVTSSYSIEYQNDSLNQPVVEFVSDASPDDIYDLYRLYYIANGWTTREEDNFSRENTFTAYVYAARGGEQANTTIYSADDGTHVVIAYTERMATAETPTE